MRIEELPKDFDESIYNNEYDGRVHEIVQSYKKESEEAKKAEEERNKMQRYLDSKDKTKKQLLVGSGGAA